MAIDINNMNFKMFTDFAATAKQSARAQFESKLVPDGEARTIKAAGGRRWNAAPTSGRAGARPACSPDRS